jgi:type VI protein secretion system component VasF
VKEVGTALEAVAQSEEAYLGRKVMEWFSRKTAIAGIQIPTWLVALGAIIVLLLIYTFMQEAQPD